MVNFICDQCGYMTTERAFTLSFAYKWLTSNRTEVALCSEFGTKSNCTGILRSGLNDKQINKEMQDKKYSKYMINL